jgi:hypothetical protein
MFFPHSSSSSQLCASIDIQPRHLISLWMDLRVAVAGVTAIATVVGRPGRVAAPRLRLLLLLLEVAANAESPAARAAAPPTAPLTAPPALCPTPASGSSSRRCQPARLFPTCPSICSRPSARRFPTCPSTFSSPRCQSAPLVFRRAPSRARLVSARPAPALAAPSSSARSQRRAPRARRRPAPPAPSPTSSARPTTRTTTCVLCWRRLTRLGSKPVKIIK